ncbi:asparagine--tRNA ligase, partial [Candidatus Bathyarchaeota archaeon]
MEEAVRVQDVLSGSLDGKEVLVRGWLQNKRSSGGIIFLFIRDGSEVVQCTVRKGEVDAKVFDLFLSTRVESSVEIEGEVKPDPRARGGREVVVHSGKIDSAALEEFPIAKQFQGPDFLLDKR